MEIYFARASWMWSLSLIRDDIDPCNRGGDNGPGDGGIRSRLEDRHLGLWYVVPTLTGVIATIGLLLTA